MASNSIYQRGSKGKGRLPLQPPTAGPRPPLRPPSRQQAGLPPALKRQRGPAQREILTGSRVTGRLVGWKGSFGWVQPFYPVNHPAAASHSGQLYLAQEDVEDDLDAGGVVSFVVYADGNGLGAMECRPASAYAEAHSVYSRSARPEQASPYSAFGLASASQQQTGGKGKPLQMGGKGKSAGKQGRRGAPPRLHLDHEQISTKVHGILTENLWETVQASASLEETWSPEEMLKRVVRYLYKGSMAEDLTQKFWREAVQFFVEMATAGYTRACGEKPWFLQLDLLPALGLAAAAIAECCEDSPKAPRPAFEEVQALAADLHQVQLQKSKVDKVVWETIQETFPAMDEKSQTKLYNALSKSYGVSFETGRSASSDDDFSRAEAFLKAWASDSLSRAWLGVKDAEVNMTEDTMTQFFTILVSAQGEDLFTCVPKPLMPSTERSVDEWSIWLQPMLSDLFEEWANPTPSTGTGKKRKKSAGGEEAEDDPAAELEEGEASG